MTDTKIDTKKPTLVYLHESVREMLRTLALHLYGLEKGSISKVAEEAIEFYYKQVINTPGGLQVKRHPRVHEAFRRVLECIKEKRNYSTISEIYQVTQQELEICISERLGHSRPTLKNYFERFVKHGYIKSVSPSTYEVHY